MRQEFGRTVESSFSPLSDSHPKLLGVPIDDDGGQQVQTRDAEVLTFSGAIADFALPPDPQCALQSMVGLAFVETYLGAALHLGIEQPFDDKQCPFDPPDFAQRKCQVVLSEPSFQVIVMNAPVPTRRPDILPNASTSVAGGGAPKIQTAASGAWITA